MSSDSEFAQQLPRIIRIIQTHLAELPCELYLFGSWATGTAQLGSDVDIAIIGRGEHDFSTNLALARYALEESTIPYKVDLVDSQQSSESFISQVMVEGQLLWEN